MKISQDESDSLDAMRANLRETVLSIVESEPELPGDMPEETKALALKHPELALRAAVIATKESIVRRLREYWANP